MSKLSNVLHGQHQDGFQIHEGDVNIHKAMGAKGIVPGGSGLAASIGPAPSPIIKSAAGDRKNLKKMGPVPDSPKMPKGAKVPEGNTEGLNHGKR